MTELKKSGGALEALRQELDGIDDRLLQLLADRFVLTDQVKALKQVSAAVVQSPLRPAREALMLRKLLVAAKSKGLDPAFVLRQWRGILSESVRLQAPLTLHVSQTLCDNLDHRLLIGDHFARLALRAWKDETTALAQLAKSPGDLCIVDTAGHWIEAMIAGKGGGAQVLQSLPVLSAGGVPKLLVLGHAVQEATGQDETLLVTQGKLPRDFGLRPLWQAKTGPFQLSALAGYFSEHESPLVGLMRSNATLGLMVAGRYPSAIEI